MVDVGITISDQTVVSPGRGERIGDGAITDSGKTTVVVSLPTAVVGRATKAEIRTRDAERAEQTQKEDGIFIPVRVNPFDNADSVSVEEHDSSELNDQVGDIEPDEGVEGDVVSDDGEEVRKNDDDFAGIKDQRTPVFY